MSRIGLRTAAGPWPPRSLSRELRTSGAPFLARRRRVIALALGAIGSLELITLFQAGIVHRLPEPPGRMWDAERVDASAEAYDLLSTPHGPLAIASYAVTAALAGMGGADRTERTPWVPLLMAAKVAADAAYGVKLARDQVVRQRALCLWCLVAAGASIAALPQVAPEARAAWRRVAG